MGKKKLLEKLKELFKEIDNLKSQDQILAWANKVAPVLKLVDEQYYVNFLHYAHRFNLPLSGYSLGPAFNIMKNQLEMAIEGLKLAVEMEESIPDQMYFSPESYLEIQKNIARIIKQAQKSLAVIDPYMDEKIVEELTEVLAPEIKLLTTNPKSLFSQRLDAAKKQFADKKIEARKSNQSHDRFYIIDREQVWSLGTSLNQAGKKATMLSKMINNKEREQIIKDFDAWWDSAEPFK